MKKGVFCISIDTELLWGRKDIDYSRFISKTKKERKIIKRLLNLFDKYSIPATWAVVGKMTKYPPTKKQDNDLWYGRDIIQLIEKSKIHELASHSDTHPEFTKLSTSEADLEIRNFLAKSFVFPRNKIAHLNILRKYKFQAYRGPDKNKWELLIPRVTPVYLPIMSNKLVNIPGSLYFVSARGIRKYIPSWLRIQKAKLGIRSAIKTNKVFHLWFHPVDFADDTDNLFRQLEEILKYVHTQHTKGRIIPMTMYQIASDYLKK